MHTNSLDEALALPTVEAATLALRTQQIIAHESGVTGTVDPLGGSYFLEKLTTDMEAGAVEYFQTIDDLGGMVEAIEQGYPQREIAESAYRFQKQVELGERDIVGVNVYGDNEELGVETLYINEDVSERQIAKLNDLRRTRDTNRVARSLAAIREVALGKTNLMPSLLEAVRAYATLGEICDALRDAWGEYEETLTI